MGKAAVLIDAGYIMNILRTQFNEAIIEYDKFAKWACKPEELFRAYYYDCLPYQSPNPSPIENAMMSAKQRFFGYLTNLDRFTVRQGKLQLRGYHKDGHPIFVQKRVDLQMGLDIATLVFRDRVDTICLVSGDSDLLPAVGLAKDSGIIVRLVHGRANSYHRDLWASADERIQITGQVIDEVRRK